MATNDFTRERSNTYRLDSRLNGKKPALGIDWRSTFLLLLAFVLIGAVAFLSGWLFQSPSGSTLPVEQISNIFLDVNGDGLVDYLAKAEVIYNPASPLAVSPAPELAPSP